MKKIRLNFEVDEDTAKLVSYVVKWVADQKEIDLSKVQRNRLTNFSLNLLLAKNMQSDEHPEMGAIAKTFFDFVGAKMQIINTSSTDD